MNFNYEAMDIQAQETQENLTGDQHHIYTNVLEMVDQQETANNNQ